MEHAAILDLVSKTTPPDANEVRTIKKLIQSLVDQYRNISAAEDKSTAADSAASAIYDAYLTVKMAHITGDGAMAKDAMNQLRDALTSVAKKQF